MMDLVLKYENPIRQRRRVGDPVGAKVDIALKMTCTALRNSFDSNFNCRSALLQWFWLHMGCYHVA